MQLNKKTAVITVLCAVMLFSGCALVTWFSGTVYFYEMAGEGDSDSTYRLRSRSSGYTIVMSRGKGGHELEKDKAEEMVDDTTFTLTLDGETLQGGEKTVDELGNTGWHVVQNFETGALKRGEYILIGTTKDTTVSFNRENNVTLKVR